jgi:two-component sensor histidine kinase
MLVAMLIVFAVVIYTRIIVDELIQREQQSIKLYTDIFKRTTDPDANLEDLYVLIEKISPTLSFPIITTDENNVPIYPYEQWTLNIKIDTTQTIQEQKNFLLNYINKMQSDYEPIIVSDSDGKILLKFFYTHSELIDNLEMFPIIEFFIIAIFIVIGYIAFSNIRKTEESKVWVGMAKEAAHQLGTPISSLLAWIEIIKYNKGEPEKLNETLDEMQKDVERLNMIATRFSKIGSLPERKRVNISDILENVCNYFEKRMPHLGKKIRIERKFQKNLYSDLNAELFQWVIENLLKNSAEAIDSKNGRVSIELAELSRNKIVITVSDNGKGMTLKQRRQIFFPGFTTKKRGWGLGLTLSKRIIEEYHNGKIFVKESSIGKGTTFQIELDKSNQ